MGFFNRFRLFSGPSVEKLEKKGDALFAAGLWGQARIAFGEAREKLKGEFEPSRDSQIADKIAAAGEALAREHRQSAENLVAGGYFDEARELLCLAISLTSNSDLSDQLNDQLAEIAHLEAKAAADELPAHRYEPDDDDEEDDFMPEFASPGDEYFEALCATLPPEVQRAYMSYGEDFKAGYAALNSGDFQTAVECLSIALEAQNGAESLIPLELAAAYHNLGKSDKARSLLEPFVRRHPDVLPAYQILCEVYWEQEAFDRATSLLSGVPSDLKSSLAVYLIQGETLFRSGDRQSAKAYYLDFLKAYGWNEQIAHALANTLEALGEAENARRIYGELMDHCNSCHRRVDPAVKRRYAELSYAAGDNSMKILELYLSLARENPASAADCLEKVSYIYAARGHRAEAIRFAALAKRAAEDQEVNG